VYIYGSYCKIKTGVSLFRPLQCQQGPLKILFERRYCFYWLNHWLSDWHVNSRRKQCRDSVINSLTHTTSVRYTVGRSESGFPRFIDRCPQHSRVSCRRVHVSIDAVLFANLSTESSPLSDPNPTPSSLHCIQRLSVCLSARPPICYQRIYSRFGC